MCILKSALEGCPTEPTLWIRLWGTQKAVGVKSCSAHRQLFHEFYLQKTFCTQCNPTPVWSEVSSADFHRAYSQVRVSRIAASACKWFLPLAEGSGLHSVYSWFWTTSSHLRLGLVFAKEDQQRGTSLLVLLSKAVVNFEVRELVMEAPVASSPKGQSKSAGSFRYCCRLWLLSNNIVLFEYSFLFCMLLFL